MLILLLNSLVCASLLAGEKRSPDTKEAKENPTGVITLRQALRLTLLQDPELAAANLDIRVAEARTLQAGVIPNPTFSVEEEDFAGTKVYHGTNEAQTTVTLSQLIELGGKRTARVRAARLGSALARWDYESRRLDVLAQTAQAFVAALAAQERIPLVEADRQLAADSLPAIDQRITAGAASPVERRRAEILVANFDVELRQARRDLAQARSRLAAQWGAVDARFSSVVGDLARRADFPALSTFAARLDAHPALARFQTEVEHRRASLALARTVAVPDVTLAPAYRHHNDPPAAEVAVVTAQVTLPLFDRNQGNIRAARLELAKAAPQREAVVLRLRTELQDAYTAVQAAREEIETLETRILPAARDTFGLIEQGYTAGKFSYLEVLDARRTLTTGRQQLLNARATLASAAARLEALTGGPLTNGGAPAASPAPAK